MATNPKYQAAACYRDSDANETVREPAAQMCIHDLERLASGMEDLAKRVDVSLSPIMRIEPYPSDKEDGVPVALYPPLFEQIRTTCHRIRYGINAINAALDRVEL